MSESFDAGLRALYDGAAREADAGPGLPVAALVARTRRVRVRRTAGVTVLTAAAVLGLAVAGTAGLRLAGSVPPAGPDPAPPPAPTEVPVPAPTEAPTGTTLPLLPPEDHLPPRDGATLAPPADPLVALPDGDYLTELRSVDAAAGTVEVDFVVMYVGQAAIDHLTATRPDAQIPPMDDYTLDRPGRTQVLSLVVGAPVWEWCSGDDGIRFTPRAGGVAEWAAAPTGSVQTSCDAGPDLSRTTLYWVDVRDGVVAQVVAQYVP